MTRFELESLLRTAYMVGWMDGFGCSSEGWNGETFSFDTDEMLKEDDINKAKLNDCQIFIDKARNLGIDLHPDEEQIVDMEMLNNDGQRTHLDGLALEHATEDHRSNGSSVEPAASTLAAYISSTSISSGGYVGEGRIRAQSEENSGYINAPIRDEEDVDDGDLLPPLRDTPYDTNYL